MNSECFLIKSLSLFSSRYSRLSDFKCNMILDPLVKPTSASSGVTVKVPPAEDSHLNYSPSSADLLITVTLSATK